MNKKFLSCLLAAVFLCTFAFSAGAVCTHRFAADVMPPAGAEIITSSAAKPYVYEGESVILYNTDPADALPESQTETQAQRSPVKSVLICVGIGAVIALIVTLAVKSSYKPVHRKRDAAEYLVDGSLQLTASDETFVRSDITERTIETKTDSNG